MDKYELMAEALKEARIAYSEDEVPIGCVIAKNGEIIARAHNTKVQRRNTLNHAEINAINIASGYLDSWYLDECELYVTLEPCMMCTGAIVNSRIKKVYFATDDPKGGSLISNIKLSEVKKLNHYPEIETDIYKEEASELLKDFFRNKRKQK